MSIIISHVVLFIMKIRFFPGKSIANIITKRYGRQHLNLFRNCEKNDYKLRKTIVKPKQAGTCGRGIRNEHTSKSLICTNIKCYRTNSIDLLSRLYAILLSITKKTARKWKFGIVYDICFVLRTQVPACFGFAINVIWNFWKLATTTDSCQSFSTSGFIPQDTLHLISIGYSSVSCLKKK